MPRLSKYSPEGCERTARLVLTSTVNVEQVTQAWINWFNHRRILELIGY